MFSRHDHLGGLSLSTVRVTKVCQHRGSISRSYIKISSRLHIFKSNRSATYPCYSLHDMKFLQSLATIGSLVAIAVAAPAPHDVHEKRDRQTQNWERRDIKLNKDAIIPMSIGLAQRNLNQGYEYLMDVSHPESKNYGKHWSMDKV